VVLPFYDPVRAAEDAAMVDVLSDGRLVFGAAIGYRPDEFALYRTPLEKRGARFEEALELIRALWTQESVTHPGPHYPLQNARLEPKPIQRPHPPIWIGGWGELMIRRAARQADAWVPGPTAHLQKLLDGKARYQAELRAAGRPDPAEWPLTRDTVIADTDAEALELAERHLLVNYRDEYGGGRWKHPLIGAEDATPVDQLDALGRDRFVIGGPRAVPRAGPPLRRGVRRDPRHLPPVLPRHAASAHPAGAGAPGPRGRAGLPLTGCGPAPGRPRGRAYNTEMRRNALFWGILGLALAIGSSPPSTATTGRGGSSPASGSWRTCSWRSAAPSAARSSRSTSSAS
jgi:hypothetical protein